VDQVLNLPEIRLWTTYEGQGRIESEKLMKPPNIFVVDERGVVAANYVEPGIYNVHTNLLPSCRGQKAVEAASEFLRFLFLEQEVSELRTSIPETMPHVKRFAKQFGFRWIYNRKEAWKVLGTLVDMGFYSITREQYLAGLEK
jgi:hypothetical protein